MNILSIILTLIIGLIIGSTITMHIMCYLKKNRRLPRYIDDWERMADNAVRKEAHMDNDRKGEFKGFM